MATELEAVRLARRAEDEAARFYADAAKRCSDPRGRDLFEQLARFETAHRDKLDRLISSLSEGGGYIEYEGLDFSSLKLGASAGRTTESGSVLEIISRAIEAEREARQTYEGLAKSADDPLGKATFQRLAEEEALHERVLNDQFYSLSNEGYWVWGE